MRCPHCDREITTEAAQVLSECRCGAPMPKALSAVDDGEGAVKRETEPAAHSGRRKGR